MYGMYLRKSRIDLEAEAQGDLMTLDRHRKILLDYAQKNGFTVGKIYKEVVSGESIEARPEVQRLIDDVEHGLLEGVLVMEIERLARGDTVDQGIIARAFKCHNTKIVTPIKTFDPSNEFDEEYFEFGLFMSRREYKVITRRIQRGRVQSAKEGRYLSSVPPYGYDRIKIKNGKGYTLTPNAAEAPVVKMIFDMYTGGSGMSVIASALDSRGIVPRYRDTWSKSTISDILKNPVYTGKIRWSYKKEFKNYNGTGKSHRETNPNYLIVDGMHEAIISDELFERAQVIRSYNTHKSTKKQLSLQNPLSGVLRCKKCGSLMTRLGPNVHVKTSTIRCSNKYCDNVSAPIYLVERALIRSLLNWADQIESSIEQNYKNVSKREITERSIKKTEKELLKIEKQIKATYDLLEQGVYDVSTFTSRGAELDTQKKELEERLEELKISAENQLSLTEIKEHILPHLREVLENYFDISNAEGRNTVLKDILSSATYLKTTRNTRATLDTMNFEIEIFPRLFSEFQ